MNLQNINPYVRYAVPSVLRRGSIIDRRIIFDYELIYIERGSFTLTYDDVPFYPKAGDFILLRPGIPHSFDCREEEVSQPHVHFDMTHSQDSAKTPVSFKDLPAMTPEERLLIQKDGFAAYPRVPFVRFADTEGAKNWLYAGIEAYGKGKTLAAKAALLSLICMLIEDNFPDSTEEHGTAKEDVFRRVRDYIDAREGVGIRLDGLEKQFAYNKFYLEQGFCRQYGMGIIAYSRKRNMEAAARLLATETVTAVAERLGHSSIYAFSRAFKRHFGTPPTGYKKSTD